MPETPAPPALTDKVRLNDLVCFAVYSANNAFNRFYKPIMAELGLTYPQFLVLMALWEEDGQGVGQLGERLGLESNTLTPLLKRMETAGVIERRRDKADERRVAVQLTPSGRDLEAKAGALLACVPQATGMTADELVALRTAVERLRDNLESARDGG
jgi:DNA-binding MarR family transcriptional regulator